MQAGLKNAYESIKAFSETDFTEDLRKIDVPTLVMHGEDEQIVPVKDSARKSARLIKGRRRPTIRARRTASRPHIRIRSRLTCWPSSGASLRQRDW
jgi:pimeloyl-ACP methyl ester carboxylesterase